MLCIVIPNTQDNAAPKFPDIHEAVDYVAVVADENDPQVKGMEAICKIFAISDPKELEKTLQRDMEDPQPMVRDYARQTLVMKLGKVMPDQAIDMLRRHMVNDKNMQNGEARQLFTLMEVEEERQLALRDFIQLNRFFCRCLIAFAQSSSKKIVDGAINELAVEVHIYHHYRPYFDYLLNPSDKDELLKIIDVEQVNSNATLSDQINDIRDWLVKQKY